MNHAVSKNSVPQPGGETNPPNGHKMINRTADTTRKEMQLLHNLLYIHLSGICFLSH